MAEPLTADDVLPLVDRLSPQERARLLRLIAKGNDSQVYRLIPPGKDEFSADDDALSWDSDGWDGVG
jgi:hypothetical protein